jgi:hydrogenase maturation factor
MKELGKLKQGNFEEVILHKCGFKRSEVSVGPSFGVDVSLVDLPNGLVMALTSDPLSLIPSLGLQESAWLSVHLMANDMATTGVAPMYAQFVLNLPPYLTDDDFKTYWDHIHQFCSDIKVSITGGHTGAIEGQNSTIAGGGTMINVAPRQDILVSKNAKPGDVILVTKQCAISSSAILAMSFPQTVKARLGKEIYDQGCELFYETSSLNDALVAVAAGKANDKITAMHDVTEGGVLGALYEMAVASGNGAVIYNEKLPIGEVQRQVCDLFSIDPRYCIGAGSMIITAKREYASSIMEALKKEHIECTAVGEMVEKDEGIHLVTDKGAEPLEYMGVDPYWNAFFYAMKNGWK